MKTNAEFFDYMKQTAAKSFNARGEHIPVFLIETPEALIPVGAPWANAAEKAAVVAAVRLICSEHKAVRVGLVFESWMVSRPHDAIPSDIVPSTAPDRQEVLWIAVQCKDSADVAGYFRIVRDPPGKPRVGEFVETHNSVTVFDGLLDHVLN